MDTCKDCHEAPENCRCTDREHSLSPASPCSAFNDLITELIDEVSNYVYPLIYRTRSTDWVVEIYDHHDPERRKRLAFGQRESLSAALDDAAENYREMERREARKEELLKEPLVREALELFKSNTEHPRAVGG